MKNKEDELFQKGIEAFNNKQFYDAHEYWEELWIDYKLKDKKFIQGLIQLSVSYFHYYNGNLNGAKSMLKKCLTKFELFETSRGIDVIKLRDKVEHLEKCYNDEGLSRINNNIYTFPIKVLHE